MSIDFVLMLIFPIDLFCDCNKPKIPASIGAYIEDKRISIDSRLCCIDFHLFAIDLYCNCKNNLKFPHASVLILKINDVQMIPIDVV